MPTGGSAETPTDEGRCKPALSSFRALAADCSICRPVRLMIARDIEVLSRQTRTREHAAPPGVQRESTQAVFSVIRQLFCPRQAMKVETGWCPRRGTRNRMEPWPGRHPPGWTFTGYPLQAGPHDAAGPGWLDDVDACPRERQVRAYERRQSEGEVDRRHPLAKLAGGIKRSIW